MSLTPEQLFQQALHDHASGLATVADPSALGGRLRHRDKMVKVYRGCLAGGAVVVLVASGLFFTGRRHDELRTAGSPEPASTPGRPPGTPPDTSEMIFGDGTVPDPTPGSTIGLGEDPGITAPPDVAGGSTTTINPLAATTTTTTAFGLPAPTLPNGQPDPDPTTPPTSSPDQPATTQPGAPTTRPVATTSPTTAPPTPTTSSITTTAPATTTTTTRPPTCTAELVPVAPVGGASQLVKISGTAPVNWYIYFNAGGRGTPADTGTLQATAGTWDTRLTLRLGAVGSTVTVTVVCFPSPTTTNDRTTMTVRYTRTV